MTMSVSLHTTGEDRKPTFHVRKNDGFITLKISSPEGEICLFMEGHQEKAARMAAYILNDAFDRSPVGETE